MFQDLRCFASACNTVKGEGPGGLRFGIGGRDMSAYGITVRIMEILCGF